MKHLVFIKNEKELSHHVPSIRTYDEMNQTAVTPALFIDSVFYATLMIPALADFQEILLDRFPHLIMVDHDAQIRVMEIMDSLQRINPNISDKEYMKILRKDHTEIFSKYFRNLNLNVAIKTVRSSLYPYQIIGNVVGARLILNKLSPGSEWMLSPDSKPYLERLGIKTDESWFGAVVRREIQSNNKQLKYLLYCSFRLGVLNLSFRCIQTIRTMHLNEKSNAPERIKICMAHNNLICYTNQATVQ